MLNVLLGVAIISCGYAIWLDVPDGPLWVRFLASLLSLVVTVFGVSAVFAGILYG